MRAVIGRMFGHQVTVEPFIGEGSNGDTFGPPVTEKCRINDGRRFAPAGERAELLAETVIYMRPAAICPARSRVTLPDGRVTVAVRSVPRNGGVLPTPAHLEVVVE